MSLDSGVKGSVGPITSLTTETKIGLYVLSKSGSSNNHRVGLEISPDGAIWMDHPQSITGVGFMFVEVVAAQVRPKVFEAEGKASSIDVQLLAR